MKALAILLSLILPAADDVVLAFEDPEITESSGLVDLGETMATVNDSGGEPLVHVVDRRGRTVGRTRYADEAVDVEALAPAGDGEVWVGDIGDNSARRASVTVYKVPVGGGDQRVAAPAFELTYPGGPRDAESLWVGPDGRLHVAEKTVFGGRVYVAPRRLRTDRPNRLRVVGGVSLFATDAAAVTGTPYVLVRGYGSAHLVSTVTWRTAARFDLPPQEQGEGLSVGPGRRIRISSEGRHAEVLEVPWPREPRRLLDHGWVLEAATLSVELGAPAR